MTQREPVRPIRPDQVDEPTVGRLVSDVSRDISALVQAELALAKSELAVSAKIGGVATALFAVAGFLGLLVLIFVSIALAYFLSMTGLHPAWCFLIVAFLYVLVGAVLVYLGARVIKKIRAPEKTIDTAKKIPAALKGQRTDPSQ